METLLNDFSPGLFIVQTILLIALIALMVKFAWKPIMDSLNERETGIADALAAAEEAKKEAREIKEKMLNDAKDQAKVEGDKMIKQAQEAIESEKKAAVADIKNQVASLSLNIAEKVIKEQLSNSDKQLKLVEDMLVDIKLN